MLNLEKYMLPCPSKKFLGIECFGCGSQRAISMVFQGEFVKAFYMFPAVYTLLLFTGFVILNFIDKKRSYGSLLISLAILNSIIMVVSYFIKHSYIFK